MCQVHTTAHIAQHDQRPEQERQTKQEIAHYSVALLIDEYHAHDKRWEHYVGQVDIIAQRHNPRCERGADVGSHDDTDGLGEG